MAFFKFRKGGDEQAPPPAATESVDVLRKRARHRLIGAAVLVLAGVVGFPLLFDSQPRPVALDIPIEIPDRAKVAPLGQADAERPAASGTVGGQSSAGAIAGITPPAAAASTTAPASSSAASSAGIAAKVPVGDNKPEPKPAAKPEPKPAPKVEPKPAAKPAAKPDAKADAKTDTKTEAKPKADAKPAASAEGRFVVQVGAYAEATSLRDARQKVEKIGFKTYTQVVGPKTAQRTRVRVGPFATKAEADKAAEKIKKLNLPAAILAL